MKVEVAELVRIKSNTDIPYAPTSAKAGSTYKGTQLLIENSQGPKPINLSDVGLRLNPALAAQVSQLELEGFAGLVEVHSEKAPNGVNVNVVSITKAKEGATIGLISNDVNHSKGEKPAFVKQQHSTNSSTNHSTNVKNGGYDDETIKRFARQQGLQAAVQIAKNGQEAIALAEVFASYIHDGVPTQKETQKSVRHVTNTPSIMTDESF